jgi:transposase-like protein
MNVFESESTELLACSDVCLESTTSWTEVPRDLRDPWAIAPEVAVGDGVLGFWASLGDAVLDMREQWCWAKKIANIPDALMKRLRRYARAALHQIYGGGSRRDTEAGEIKSPGSSQTSDP